MVVLGKVKVQSNWSLKETEKLIRTFSMFYVNALFKSYRNLKYKQELQRLQNLQNYIIRNYNIKQDIKHIILNILCNIKLNNKGLLYIKKEQINTIKINEIYKLICFGNIEVRKSAIFNDAIKFGIIQTRMIKKYGY